MKKKIMTALLCCYAIALFTACVHTDNASSPASDGLADYTVIYFVSNGYGQDHDFDDQIADVQPLLTDRKVRFYCFNKYCRLDDDFSGRYGDPGMALEFELTAQTCLDSLRYTSVVGDSTLVIFDPAVLRGVLDRAYEKAPARQYVLVIEGHGLGFAPDIDYPKDGPKWGESQPYSQTVHYAPRPADAPKMKGLLRDYFHGRNDMNMYELRAAIASSQLGHLPLLMFNVCLMADLESITEIKDVVDYLIASPFSVSESTGPVTELVRALQEQKGLEAQVDQMFRQMRPRWIREYVESGGWTGNFALYDLSCMDEVIDLMRQLGERLCQLYPTRQEAIDRATDHVYQYQASEPHYDSMDYTRLLAQETGDSVLQDIYERMQRVNDSLVVMETVYADSLPSLPRFSMAVSLFGRDHFTTAHTRGAWSFDESYERCTFHQLTHWGRWLRTNQQEPTNNPAGQPL